MSIFKSYPPFKGLAFYHNNVNKLHSVFLFVFIHFYFSKFSQGVHHLNVVSRTQKIPWQSHLWATLPSWISCTNIPSSPRFSLLNPTTLNPRPPQDGLSSSKTSTWRPYSGNKARNKIKSQSLPLTVILLLILLCLKNKKKFKNYF